MKRYGFIIVIVLVFCIAGSLFADSSQTNVRVRSESLLAVPDYLIPAYNDPENVYLPRITCYNADINKAGHIVIQKYLYDKAIMDKMFGINKYYYYKGFLDDNNEDIDKICKMLPVVRRTEKYDRFEFLQYDAEGYMDYREKNYDSSAFSVIKDKGRVIWYCEGDVPGDIAITGDGRYMIATPWCVFYVYPAGERIISEVYAGNRIYWSATMYPNDVRILTANIIRVAYPNGLTEHWQVRLSTEDIDKNMAKYKKDEKWEADKCLLWSNGKKKAHTSQAMWCYYESEEEPEYKETNLADVRTAVVSAFRRVASSSAAGNRPAKSASADAANSAGEAKTGFFASLFGRIKTFFAGLFA